MPRSRADLARLVVSTTVLLGASPAPSGAVVVIDVLRAFSTAAYAMSLGAERIVLAASLDQARALQVLQGPPLSLR